MDEPVRRIRTYVQGLDERMDGGIPEGFVVLVCGRAGSMKSTLAFNILFNHAKERNGRSLYMSLEQRADSLSWHMKRLGMDPAQVADKVMILDLTRLREKETGIDLKNAGSSDWMPNMLRGVTAYKASHGCDIVVLDSLDALYTLSTMENPRVKLFNFIEGLRDLKLTTILITEIKDDSIKYGQFGIESFLADGIIHQDLVKDGKVVGLQIGVPKMRGTNHTRNYYPLIIDGSGFRIVAK